jgi:hypothetical protein
MLSSMAGFGKGAREERSDTAMPSSHVRDARNEPLADSSRIQSTVPSRQSEALARSEGPLVDADLEDGAKTSAMEAVSLIEAELEIARQARESGRSGARAISTDARAEEAPPIAVGHEATSDLGRSAEAEPSAASPVGALALAPPPREPSPEEREVNRRRRFATLIVAVVMLAALALAGIGLARKGWALPAETPSPLSH